MNAVVWPALALALALPLALAIDRWWGEPPAAWHPVVWMGRALGYWGERLAPAHDQGRNLKVFWASSLIWCAFAAIVVIAFASLQYVVLAVMPLWLAPWVLALLLKPLLAWRMLRDEVSAVQAALDQSLDAGRAQLARLVSRDVAALDADGVREAAIESLAENFNDSVVAPLFWFALLGLPGAALYRFANTADAMWGYPGMRGGRHWQWAGKWAARADDVLSWLPARLAAFLMAWAAQRWPMGLAAEARKTPSPNSGWPMAAMALLLDVRLGKPGVYQLHPSGRLPGAMDVMGAVNIGKKSMLPLIVCGPTATYLIAKQWM